MDTIRKYITTKTRTDVVLTIYDTMKTDLGAIAAQHLSTQENLLKRVAAICYFPSLGNTYGFYTILTATPYFASHYSYDLTGNVKTVSYEFAPLAQIDQKWKRVDYDYDLVSGKVNMLSYNRGRADQFYHKYDYDADNRLTEASTSNDGVIWNKDARYKYYRHGPLANVKIGDLMVQSVDYAYTINGWLKTINSDVLRLDKDMGNDGAIGLGSRCRLGYCVLQ
jgi:hypothetical protein